MVGGADSSGRKSVLLLWAWEEEGWGCPCDPGRQTLGLHPLWAWEEDTGAGRTLWVRSSPSRMHLHDTHTHPMPRFPGKRFCSVFPALWPSDEHRHSPWVVVQLRQPAKYRVLQSFQPAPPSDPQPISQFRFQLRVSNEGTL